MGAPKPSKKEIKKPSVFDFLDFREFIVAVHDFRKSVIPSFNYTEFAKLSGMNSPNLMRLIVQGHRNLTDSKVKKVAKACGLDRDEAKYFIALVKWNQSKSAGDQAAFWQEIVKQSNESARVHLADSKELVAITQWPALALIELTRMPNFKQALEGFKVKYANEFTSEEIDQLFEDLVEAGLLKKTSNGFQATNATISSGDKDRRNKFIQQYHTTLLLAAMKAIADVPVENRQLDALTVSVGEKEMKEIKSECQEFAKKILGIVGKAKNPDRVYQLNLQLYPIWHEDEE